MNIKIKPWLCLSFPLGLLVIIAAGAGIFYPEIYALDAALDLGGWSLGLVGLGALATAVTVTFLPFRSRAVTLWVRIRISSRASPAASVIEAIVPAVRPWKIWPSGTGSPTPGSTSITIGPRPMRVLEGM